MNQRLQSSDFPIGIKPRINVSVPPTSNVPEGCFEYSDSPEPRFIMDTTKKQALKFIYGKLTDLAERKKDYETLPEDNPDRIVFNIKHWILVWLTCVDNRGELTVKEAEMKVRDWGNYNPELFTQGVYRALEELNLFIV